MSHCDTAPCNVSTWEFLTYNTAKYLWAENAKAEYSYDKVTNGV